MFCPNCGNKLNDNEAFCGACGTKIKENVSFSEKLRNENKLKKFIQKYPRQIKILGIGICVFLIVIIAFDKLIGFEKFKWDKTYDDYNLKSVSPTKISLGLNVSSKVNLDKVKYEVSCGNLENDKEKLTWDLSEAVGNCNISVKYKLRKLKKSYTVIKSPEENELYLEENNLDGSLDIDNDGLTNDEETKYNTDPLLSDTDMDGLNDYEEIFTYKTDPLKSDTDDDGVSDFDEVTLGLDPLKKYSAGDGVLDNERELAYTYEKDNVKLNVNGMGNLASTLVTKSSNTKISNKIGLINNLYAIDLKGNVKSANISISYTDEELEKYGLNENDLTLYGYDTETSSYTEISSNVDLENNTINGLLKEFYYYIVGDKTLFNTVNENEILFIIDNSWSMYSPKMYEKITGEKYTKNELNNDPEGLRFSLTTKLIDKLDGKNFEFGLAEFRRDYAIANNIGDSTSSIKNTLSQMNGNFITNTAGTNIVGALNNGIKEFNSEKNKYIVLLTDGEDDELSDYANKIIENANKNEVKICSIGFDEGASNTVLAKISNSTGCQLFSASNANGLVELFSKLEADLLDSLVDLDDDLDIDGVVLADSGFVVNKDGFSFANYGSNLSSGGHCYGMATFAEFYYLNKLPLTMSSVTIDKYKSYAYNLNNTYFKNFSNLYDYKLQSNILKYQFSFDYFNENKPADYKIIDDDTLKFNNKYRSDILNSNIYDIVVDKTPIKKKEQKNLYGETFKEYEHALLNEDKMQKSNSIDNDDKQLFNAIYSMYIKQFDDELFYSGMELTQALIHTIENKNFEYYSSNAFLNILITRITSGDVPVISANFTGKGQHAINALSIIQDVKDHSRFYIGVYDNNYPGELRYVNIICNKKTCVTEKNEYYDGNKRSIRMTPSLDQDLTYFNN